MAAQITTLTPAHIARIPEWVNKWVAVGLSTEPADFDAAEAAGRACYRAAGLPEPLIVLRMGSPYAATVGGWLAVELLEQARQPAGRPVNRQVERQVGRQVEHQVRRQVRRRVEQHVEHQVWQQVWHQVWQQVWRQVGQQVEHQVRQQVGQPVAQLIRQQVEHQVRQQVDQQVERQVWQQVRQQVGQQVDRRVRQQVGHQVWQQVWQQVRQQVDRQVERRAERQAGRRWTEYRGASLWAGFYAYITFLRDVVGWEDESLTAFACDEQLALSCGWTWWDGAVLAISDRPESITFDAQHRLHNETGPAIRYRDGWSIYCWRGVSVPADWIERRSELDPRAVIAVENVEQRAAGAAIVGWPKMLSVLDARVIDGDPDTELGALVELTLPGLPEPGRFLQARCPRNGTIVEGVPRVSDIDGLPIDTALAAQAWRIGDPQDEYIQPEVRT